MLVFNCTKAATAFFTKTRKGVKYSPVKTAPEKTIAGSLQSPTRSPKDNHNKDQALIGESKHWHWLVHAIKVKRKSVLVLMEYESRFAMTFTGLKKGDTQAFLNMFKQHLSFHIHELLPLVLSDPRQLDSSVDLYYQLHHSNVFYQRGDRSVQSHINDVAWHIEMTADEMGELPAGIDLIGFDSYINHTLRSHKGGKDYFVPQQAFLHQWLCEYSSCSRAQADQKIKALQEQEKARYQAMHNSMFDVFTDNATAEMEALITELDDMNVKHNHENNVIQVDFSRKKH